MCTCPKLVIIVIMSVWMGGGGIGERGIYVIRPKFLQNLVPEALYFLYFAKLVTAVLFTAKGFPT